MEKPMERIFSAKDGDGWEKMPEPFSGLLQKRLISDPERGMTLRFVRCPAGGGAEVCLPGCAAYILVTDGEVRTEGQAFRKGALIRLPAGGRRRFAAGAEGALALVILNLPADAPAAPKTAEGMQTVGCYDPRGWTVAEEPKGCFFDDRPGFTDPETGMIANFTRYPAGFWKPSHRHTCSHGIYVLDGALRTDGGVYPEGSLVWHPAGFVTGHGAPEDTDCRFLFVASHAFDIEFV